MTHVDLINLWPSLSDFASDLSISYGTAKAMRRRGTIPSGYWSLMVEKALERNIAGVTLEILAHAVAVQASSSNKYRPFEAQP